MSKRTDKIRLARARARAAKARRMRSPGALSRYAQKRAYLVRASKREGVRVWGFEFPEPKPWKGARS
jgi:hypothetical protein